MFYLDPLFWMAVIAAGVAGALLTVAIAALTGSARVQRPEARRLGLGVALFAPAPILLLTGFGPLAGFLYLMVSIAVLGREGIGPAIAAAERDGAPVSWGQLLTRGIAFATGSLATFYGIAGLIAG